MINERSRRQGDVRTEGIVNTTVVELKVEWHHAWVLWQLRQKYVHVFFSSTFRERKRTETYCVPLFFRVFSVCLLLGFQSVDWDGYFVCATRLMTLYIQKSKDMGKKCIVPHWNLVYKSGHENVCLFAAP